MAKKYDIVETSKMSAEYDASLIVGTCYAKEALENGRFIVVDEVKKEAKYPATSDDDVVLNASVERQYETHLGLTEFRVEEGGMPRGFRYQKGDVYITTAIAYTGARKSFDEIEEGDFVVPEALTGKAKVEIPDTVPMNFQGIVMEKTTLGYDKTPAIKIFVKKA